MQSVSTIQLRKDTIEQLKKAKEYPKQTYNELLGKMARIFIKLKERNQYDEFLHKIQQPKMRELWDNKEDEAWENA
jgi:rRNA pseudouridine-1189 N-methylase Emg1 (Nep1/Mra1 family)